MRKKFLFSVFIIVLVCLFMQTVNICADSESVVFLDADTNKPISEIDSVQNVKAKLGFSASGEGEVNIISAGYDEYGRMVTGLIFETVTVTAENKDSIVYTTAPVSSTGVSSIKVFAWEKTTLKPVLDKCGVLNKVFVAGDDFKQKLISADGITQDTPYTAVKGVPFAVSDVLSAVNGSTINSEFFSITSDKADMVFEADTSDWTKGTLTFSETGIAKISATDYDFCIPTLSYIEVIEPVDRYYTKFVDSDKYLYRVGNKNSVSVSSLFGAKDVMPAISNITVDVANVKGDADGTYNREKETVTFTGTGVVNVTIKDKFSTEYSLLLEVIDAKNITKAESAKTNDVVLLNDISGASFVVSNGHTFYGNGFTVNLATHTVQEVGQGFTGYVSIGASDDASSANGGNLDNVKIVGPVYPEMYIYRDQAKITNSSDSDYGNGENMRYFKNSVIVYGGNCTISNSYISGSRTALCLRGGSNIVVENTTLSGGAYANMQICSGSSVTLRSLTTVQTDVPDSYGKGKYAHGLGIAVDTDVVDLYIEGELNQYNWLCKEQWNSIVPSEYQSSFPKFFTNDTFSKYWHYLDGGTEPYVNMAFIYACNWNTEKIHDNRTTVDYDTCNATIAGVAGGVYSKVNTVGGNAITDANLTAPAYVALGFNPVAPVFKFDNSPNADEDDANDEADTYCVYNESTSTLKIGLSGESKTIDLSKVVIDKNGTALNYRKYLNDVEITGDTVTIKTADGTKQKLTFKATGDGGYDKDGNIISGEIEYTWNVTVEVATLAFPAPVWNMGGTYQFDAKTNCLYAYYATTSGYGEAVPIYDGVKVDYYNKQGQLVNLDLSNVTTKPTGSANSNSNAFTYALADGSTLVMKFSSGWKSGATTHEFAVYKNKVYIYPQSLDNDNYIREKVTNQDFDVKITYNFTDPYGQSTGTQTFRWYNEKSTNSKVTTVQWKTFDSEKGKKPSCVTGDTLVTLADGSYKRIDEITNQDKLLVWDFYNGEYAEATSAIFSDHGYSDHTVVKLIFDDSTEVKIITLHQFFDAEYNKFVTIDADNVKDFVNHSFIKRVGDGYKTVKLVDYEISQEYVGAYGIISAEHYNFLVADMLSTNIMLEEYCLFNCFDVGENMMYDAEKMAETIETYGLYSYDDFSEYLTYEQFEALNMKYMKIAVCKGQYTFERILALIDEYLTDNQK